MRASSSLASRSELQPQLIDFALSGAFSDGQLLSALLDSAIMGVAILDQQFRFQAINNALAGMIGISPEAHLGKTIGEVLGGLAAQLEPMLRKVLSEGRLVPSFEVAAVAPMGTEPVRWMQSYFPIRDASGRVSRVGMMVVQVTGRSRERSIPGPTDKLLHAITPREPAQFGGVDHAELRSSPFRDLDASALDLILGAARPCRRSPGEFFCRQHEKATTLYLLTAGRAKLSGLSRAGKEVLIDWMGVGDVVGLGALVPSSIDYCWTACAVEDSEALQWDRATIQGFAACWPSLFENGLLIAMRWAGQLQERLEEVATEMVEQRLAHVTSRLVADVQSNGVAELRVSDEELAQMIGTDLFTVNRIVNHWQKLGYVQKSRRRLLVRDRENLWRIAVGTVGSQDCPAEGFSPRIQSRS